MSDASVISRRLVREDDPILRQVSAPVTEFDQDLQDLVRNMFQIAMRYRGVGLAAVQIGVAKRVIIVQRPNGFLVMVNPEFIRKLNRMTEQYEGCLSLPGRRRKVSRPAKCEMKWQDLNGIWHSENFEDAEIARIIQHEMDHLEGILITDK